jgi:hypothetical protein
VRTLLAYLLSGPLLLGFFGTAEASNLQITASVSDSAVAIGDVFVLQITAVTTINSQIEIQVPAYPFAVELGRRESQSSSFSFGTGGQQIKREQTLNVELQAQEAGTFRIENIQAQAGTDRATALAPSISIAKSQQVFAARAVVGQIAPPAENEKNLFARYRPNKAKVYLGEEIILDLDIFTNGNFSLDNTKPPALDGFWREMIDQPNQLRARNAQVGNTRYRAYRLWRMAIFPLEAGTRLIEATQLSFSMNRSIFSGGNRIRRNAPPLEIEVLPLPTEGRPSGFVSTNVGVYQLSARIDKSHVPAGKAVMLKLILQGKGNIKSAHLPKVEQLDGFRIFPPTIDDSVDIGSQGVSGRKEMEMILMPTRGGRLNIPSIELSVFNPVKASYERLQTRAFTVFVSGDPSAANQAPVIDPSEAQGLRRRSRKSLDKSALRPLRFRSELRPRSKPIMNAAWFFPTLFAPFFFLVLIVFSEQLKAQITKETPASKQRKAVREARQRLTKAKDAAANSTPEQAYTQISDVLLAFASDKTQLAVRGLTLDETRTLFVQKGADETLIDAFIEELENCDFARFAPGAQEQVAMESAFVRAFDLIAQLEAWVPK